MVIIIDNGSTDNLVLSKTVAVLKLPTVKKHDKPYQLGWIKTGEAVKVTHQCWVPLTTDKYYGNILCDIVPMDFV